MCFAQQTLPILNPLPQAPSPAFSKKITSLLWPPMITYGGSQAVLSWPCSYQRSEKPQNNSTWETESTIYHEPFTILQWTLALECHSLYQQLTSKGFSTSSEERVHWIAFERSKRTAYRCHLTIWVWVVPYVIELVFIWCLWTWSMYFLIFCVILSLNTLMLIKWLGISFADDETAERSWGTWSRRHSQNPKPNLLSTMSP